MVKHLAKAKFEITCENVWWINEHKVGGGKYPYTISNAGGTELNVLYHFEATTSS